MPSILFICTANQFRSPIAAACLARAVSAQPEGETWVIESAGTWAAEGLPAPRMTLRAARRLGIDNKLEGLESHRTRQVTGSMLQAFDLLLVMESGHKEALAVEFPAVQERLALLSEAAAGTAYDIPDPARPNVDADAVARELDALVTRGKERILALARSLHG